jgi:hypothetical protein
VFILKYFNMINNKIETAAKQMLTNERCEKFINYLNSNEYNSARLVIDNKLMELDRQQTELKINGLKDPVIDAQIKECNKLYDYTINAIESSITNKTRANGRKKHIRKFTIGLN